MRYQKAYDFRAETIAYLVACDGLTEEEAIQSATDQQVYQDLLNRVMQRICKADGHKIVDDSYGNPDHGAIDMSCTRCGWSYHHTLY